MSASDELKIRKLLEDTIFYINNAEEDETFIEKSNNNLNEADNLIRSNTRENLSQLSLEIVVKFAEVALMTKNRDDDIKRVLDLFFQRTQCEDQFYVRALLAYSRILVSFKNNIQSRQVQTQGLKGEDNLKQIQEAFSNIQRSLDIITKPENKQKYHFLIYNTAVTAWKVIKPFLKPGWSKNFADVIEKLSNLLEELDDSDLNLRCRFLNVLSQALMDADKKPDALKIFDKLWDLTKKKGECAFQETLLRNRIHLYRDNNGALGNVKKDTETGEDKLCFKQLFVLQQIRSGVIPEAQVEKELTTLMAGMTPASVAIAEGKDPSTIQSSSKLPPLVQDRLAEAGRLALKYNLIQLAEGAVSVVGRSSQGSLRAKVWSEYSKAELILKKQKQSIDPKTGMKLNIVQRQVEEFQRRLEALKIMDRAMIANKRLNDPDIIIEGSVMIWNFGLPLLKKSTRQYIYKPFQSAANLLETIESNECSLRVCLHLELAKYEIEQDLLSKAQIQVKKALGLDYSTSVQKLGIELGEDDDPTDFQRTFDRYLKSINQKLSLKQNLYGEPETILEQTIIDVENAKGAKSQKMRETLLEKALKSIIEYEQPDFYIDPQRDLVQEEIEEEQRKFHLRCVKERKLKTVLASEISKLALEENLIDIALEAGQNCVQSEWDAFKDKEQVICQSEAHYVVAQCYIEYLLEEEIEIGFEEVITLDEDQDDRDFTTDDKKQFQEWKAKFATQIQEGVKKAMAVNQSWLIFNGSIHLWNNYLPVFKKVNFYELVLKDSVPAFQECYESMNNCFISGQFTHDNVDYNLSTKMNTFTNLAMILARIHEFNKTNDEALRICDTLLQKQLPPQLRKTFDSIRARITKQPSGAAAGGGGKAAPAGKGGKDAAPAAPQPSQSEILTSEVISLIELITAQKGSADKKQSEDMIKKAMDTLQPWEPVKEEEIELELHAELWSRLGRLAIDLDNNQMTKTALFCSETVVQLIPKDDRAKDIIPVMRLRWYAVAQSIYGEALAKLVDTEKQEKESQDKLLFASVEHYVESCNLATKSNLGYVLIEVVKMMWNTLLPLLDNVTSRRKLIPHMVNVHKHLKTLKEGGDPDFLVLFYSAMFTCITENKEWKLGETSVDEAFTYVPQTHQKVLWEAKMLYLSKLGKNVLQAISNMKEGNSSLQAKVWVKLARSSANQFEQHSAYNKAVELLRKDESVEVVEILIEYSEWLHRNKFPTQDVEDNLQLASDQLTDIEPGWDDEEDEEGEDPNDHKSRKTGRSKGSRMSRQSMAKTKVSKVSKRTGAKKSMAGGKSTKSRASSRRTAMSRGTNKTRQTKTGLSKRQEEDPQPMFLNVSHYEKMIRIHSMLATLAIDSNKQREYALDAHFFIMKIWEQSFQTFNALVFLEEHKTEMEQLGFSDKDAESRNFFYSEVFTNPEIKIPVKHDLPEGNQNWINYSIPEEFVTRAQAFEDKTMLCKWAFVKPELTLYHIQNIIGILEENYLHIQMLPIIQLGKLFSKLVLENESLSRVFDLKLARLLINLGLKTEGNQIREELGDLTLDEITRKVQFENIKALKDPHDDLQNQYTSFEKGDELEPWVIEQLKIHETWIVMGEELIKWGEFDIAMTYIVEANLHARILKDQDNFALTFLHLAYLSHLQGEQTNALKLDMMCQQYSRKVPLIRLSIKQALDHLVAQGKIEDAQRLLQRSIEMFEGMKSNHDAKVYNVELSMIIQYLYIEQAKLCVSLSGQSPKLKSDENDDNLEDSFKAFHKFERMMSQYGWKNYHIEGAIEYSWMLFEKVQTKLTSNLNHIRTLERKLEKTGLILIKVQEILTNQVYHIGIQSDQSFFSLPLIRMIGVVKVKLAQVNNTIGVLKNQLKLHIGLLEAGEKDIKLDRVIQNWLEGITHQIDAQTKQGKRKLNRYEKSIAMLHSALNMLHPQQPQYVEALVELAKCKRLLAVNKKHIRGIWRQDAQEIDDLAKANQIEKLKEMELNEEIDDDVAVDGAKNIKDEARDRLLNYKDEAIQAFVEILSGTHNTEELDVFSKILTHVGDNFSDNLLARFSLEYAETRGNLNKEQCFAFIAMYQFSIQRQHLWSQFKKQCAKQNVDLLRKQQIKAIEQDFSYFTSPFMPEKYNKLTEEDKEKDKAFENLNSAFPYNEVKEILPQQSCYVIFQLSQDWQYLYVGLSKVPVTAEGATPGERKIDYHLTKLTLSEKMQNKLQRMVDDFEQVKHAMIKTPITIEQDLKKLISDSNSDLQSLLNELEEFLAPITKDLNNFINPEPKEEVEEAAPVDPKAAAKGKAPAKAPPAAKGKGGAEELAKYESNLPLTTGGIESLVLLLDHRIATLPFEALKVFEKVPAVAKDFSLHLHVNRLKRLGHKAELHNNFGAPKDNLKYIFNPNEQMKEQLKETVGELPKKVAGSKWEGVITTDHIPSSGEWQRLISDSSLFTYFSTSSILHTFSPFQITEISNFNKCRAMVIMDRMNTYKSETDKTSLTSKNFRNLDQPLQTISLFSTIGVNTIMINHWAVQPETNNKIFNTILDESGTNQTYLGAALRQFRAEPTPPEAVAGEEKTEEQKEEAAKEEKLDLMTRLSMSTWGVPLLRIV